MARQTIPVDPRLDSLFPVGMATRTGYWGWERVHDCLDLSRCVYATEAAAKRARRQEIESYGGLDAYLNPTFPEGV